MEKELPKGWVNTKLGVVAEWGSGGTPNRSEPKYYDGTIPWVKTGDLNDSIILEASEYITELGLKKSSAKLFPKGSIIVAMYGATIGKTAKLGIDATTNQACAVAIASKIVVPEFLHYFLKSEKQEFIDKGKGGAQPNISQTVIKEHPFPLPPLPEQQRIVSKLDTLFVHLDALKTRLERIPQLIKEFRQKVLTQAVTGKLTEDYNNIENWDIVSIDRLVGSIRTDIRTGPFGSSLNKSEHQLDGIPVWGIESISKKGEFTGQNKIFITKAKAKELKSFEVLGGDIIISRSGTVGELCLLPNDISFGIISTNLMKISLNKKVINPTFFCYQFKGSQELLDKLQELCSGSTRLFLTQSILNKLVFVLPPLEEQQEIVRRVETLFAKADQIEAGYQKLKAKVDQLPQALLAKAFRGELVPQLPTDGDSRELLEEIKKAKAVKIK